MTAKKVIAIVLVILFLSINIPVRYQLKDGGTVVYRSVLWQYEKVHSMIDDGYNIGTRFSVLGIELFDDVSPVYPVVVY